MTSGKKAAVWLSDYSFMFRGALASLVYRKPPKHYLGHVVEGKIPVMLLPGILGTWSFMKPLGDAMSKLGHPVYVLPELGYNLSNIPDSAALLRSCIDRILLDPPKRFVLVAHSKGGLIGKYFLAHHNTDNAVLGMVSVATPFSGSAMAKLIPLDSFRELDTDSKIIRDLSLHTEVNAKIISIFPEYDNHVWAKERSFLQGAENIEVPVSGHHKVVFSEKVRTIVLASIDKFLK